jgi:hypothetical protein
MDCDTLVVYKDHVYFELETKPEFLSSVVSTTASATSTISYEDAHRIAIETAKSVCENNVNIINQTLTIATDLFNSNLINNIIINTNNIYIVNNKILFCLHLDYSIKWKYIHTSPIICIPVIDQNNNILIFDNKYLIILNNNGLINKTIIL